MIETAAAFTQHVDERVEECRARNEVYLAGLMARTGKFFQYGDDPMWCNAMLENSGHYELKLRDKVTLPALKSFPDPLNQNHAGLFAVGFAMREYHEDKLIPIRISTLESMREEGFPDRFKDRAPKDHRARKAFYRALCLAPGFMINLTADISSGDRNLKSYGPEIYIAYNIMSNLVDARDAGAVRPDGSPNRGYLFTRTARRTSPIAA